MAIGNGQQWANLPGRGKGKGGQGDKTEQTSGGGFGTWHDEDSWMYPEFKDKWDGTFMGEPLPVESYFFTIDLKLPYIEKLYKGVVTIVR